MAVVSPCFMMYGLLQFNSIELETKLTDETSFLVDNIQKVCINTLKYIPKELEGSLGLRQVITSTNYGLELMRQ